MKKLLLLGAGLTAIAGHAATVNIQGTDFKVDTLSHHYIGPGVTQSHLVFSTPSRTFHAYVLDKDEDLAVNVRTKVDIGKDQCKTAEAITSMAARKTNATTQYLGGINGDFFITSSFASQHEFGNAILGYPNMSCATGGKIAAPDMIDITSRENAFIVGNDGMWIDATDLKYRVLNDAGTVLGDAKAINYPRRAEEMMVYNSYNGATTGTETAGRELLLKPAEGATWRINKTVKFIVDGDWKQGGNSAIPADGLVISCGANYTNAKVDTLKNGDTVKLKIVCSLPAFDALKPDIKEICGGDVRVLKENQVTTQAIRWINTPSAKYSRSLVGYSQDRKHTVLCAIDANSFSTGVTYYESADVMRFLGCWDALDLDGGGSTAIWSHSSGIFNTLRDGSERAVGNGIFFVLDAPKDKELASIRFADWAQRLPRHAHYAPVVYGYNAHGQLVDANVQGFVLEAAPELGEVNADGQTIHVTGDGAHTLTARLGDMTATLPLTIDGSAVASPRVPALLVNHDITWPIELQATVGDKIMPVAAQAYEWTVADAAVASVDANGNVSGLKNGQTTVTGTLGDHTIAIPVTVEIPATQEISIYPASTPDDWTISRTSVNPATVTVGDDNTINVNYKVTSTRGPKVTIKNEQSLYSLPRAVNLTVNTNGAALSAVSVNVQAANAKTVTIKGDAPATAGDTKYNFDLTQAMDLNDPAVYPVKLVSVVLEGPATTGTYNVALSGINSFYSTVGSGVEDVAVNGAAPFEILQVAVQGNTVMLPFAADTVEVYTAAGAKIAAATSASDLTVTANGFMVVLATKDGKTFAAKIVK